MKDPRGSAVSWISAAALALLIASLFGYDLARVRNSAVAARSALQAGLDAFAAGDVQRATTRLAAVRRHVAAAAAGADGPFWEVAAAVPGLSDSLDVAEVTIDTADEAADVAAALVGQVDTLTNPDGTTRIRDAEGNLDFEPIEQAAAGVADLQLEPLELALDRLAATPSSGLLSSVAAGRRVTLTQGRRMLSLARDARAMAEVLPSFLGADRPREYFLAMQNVGELRGTGGLIGFFATVRVSEGQLELSEPRKYEVLDQRTTTGDPEVIAPDTLPDGFLERYGEQWPTSFLANANLDPHLPTVAEILLNLYEHERGRRLDGVIVMDPIGLAYAHAAIGPVTLPPGTPHGSLPTSIPPSGLAPILMIDAYDVLGGASPQRKVFLATVAETAFRNITSGKWSALAMMRWLSFAAGSGHLQVYSTRPDEQAVFEELEIAGTLAPPEHGDLLAVTANNAAGNKSDVHVGHAITGTIRLAVGDSATDGTMTRTADLRVAVTNPLPTSGRDEYIIGSSEPHRGFVEAFTGPPGLNRTWFTVWVPGGDAEFTLTNANGTFRPDPDADQLRGLSAVDYVLETPSESTRSFGVGITGSVPVEVSGDQAVYTLHLHRQSKGIPDRLDLTIRAPQGWTIAGAEVSGGGSSVPLFGVYGEIGPPVTVRIEDETTVRLAGDMTRDVTLVLRLTPAA